MSGLKLITHNRIAQKKCVTKHDWVGKVIHWGLCKSLKFDDITKKYVTRKIFWDTEIQTDHPIPVRRPDQVLINTKKLTSHQVDFPVLEDDSVKREKNE